MLLLLRLKEIKKYIEGYNADHFSDQFILYLSFDFKVLKAHKHTLIILWNIFSGA